MKYSKTPFMEAFVDQVTDLVGHRINRMGSVGSELPLFSGHGVVAPLDPADVFEALVAGVARQARESVKAVTMEPNGENTYPDVQVTFVNGYTHCLEVKSYKKSRGPGYDLAAVNLFEESLEQKNPKYFKSDYVVGEYVDEPEHMTLTKVEVGKIWTFSDGASRGGNRNAIRPNRRETSSLIFLHNATEGNPVAYRNGVEMLLGLKYVTPHQVAQFEEVYRTRVSL